MALADQISDQDSKGKSDKQPTISEKVPTNTELTDGEELLWSDRPILLAYLYGGYDIQSLAALVLGLVFLSIVNLYFLIMSFPWFFLIFSIIPLLVVLYQLFPLFKYLAYQNITYQITSKRLLITDSRLSSGKISIDLDQISKVSETTEKMENKFKAKSVTITPKIHNSSLKTLHYTMTGIKKTAKITELLKAKD